MEGEGPQVAVRVNPDRIGANLGRRYRLAAIIRALIKKMLDLPLALLRLERAGAIDEKAAGLDELRRSIEQAGLKGRRRSRVLFAFQVKDVGVAPDGSGRRTRYIEK